MDATNNTGVEFLVLKYFIAGLSRLMFRLRANNVICLRGIHFICVFIVRVEICACVDSCVGICRLYGTLVCLWRFLFSL